MTLNNKRYRAFSDSKLAEAISQGYIVTTVSTDLKWGIGVYPSAGDEPDITDNSLNKPNYVTAKNWPFLDYQESLNIVQTPASSKGGNDGYAPPFSL